MPENFAIAQKILAKLVKTRPFKFQYSYSPLKDISPGDIGNIITIFLEIKEREKQTETKTPSDSVIELTDEEKQALEMLKEIEKQAETKTPPEMELTDEEKGSLERMDWMIEEIKLNKTRYLRLLAYEKGRLAEEKTAESFGEKNCCKPEDMRPYRGQKGSVSRATHFCRVCGQHWIFEKAAKPGEQEWFSATPATSALEKKDGS